MLDYHDAGIEVARLVDLRPDGENSSLCDAVVATGTRIQCRSAVTEAIPDKRGFGVAGAIICPIGADGYPDQAHTETIACDGIAVAVGWMPNLSLP